MGPEPPPATETHLDCRADVPELAKTSTASYRSTGSAAYWDVVEPVVTAAVDRAARVTGRPARALFPIATAFVVWAWQTKAVELAVPRMFRKQLVEEFAHRGMTEYSRGSRATYRSALNAMVSALTPPSDASFPIPRSEPTPPYSASEINALLSWANAQPSASRREDARVLLTLGCGAGLATRELLSLRVEDVFVSPESVQVMVWSDRPRLVPILNEWDGPLRTAVDAPPHTLVFRPGRTTIRAAQVTDFLHRGHQTHLDVRPARMRTTWILAHLSAGTPPRDLLRIAGLENLAALDRVARFLPPAPPMPVM